MSWPGSGGHRPSCPHPVIRPYTESGVALATRFRTEPERSATPGRKPSTNTSASPTRSSTDATPSAARGRRLPTGDFGAARRTGWSSRHARPPVWYEVRRPTRPLDAQHFGAQIGQHHASEGRRAEAREPRPPSGPLSGPPALRGGGDRAQRPGPPLRGMRRASDGRTRAWRRPCHVGRLADAGMRDGEQELQLLQRRMARSSVVTISDVGTSTPRSRTGRRSCRPRRPPP